MSNIDSLVLNVKKYLNVLNIKVPTTPPVIATTPPVIPTTPEEYIKDKLSLCEKYINLYKHKPVITCIDNINSRIIAIGDIHGDIDLMLNTLLISKVIQKKPNKEINNIELNNKGNIEYYEWIGGDTIVVQVGDQIDRCRPGFMENLLCDKIGTTFEDEASDIEILLFFTQLHELAIKQGGAVYSLLGNHELMNAEGDVRYVSLENLKLANKEGNTDITEGWKELFKRGGTLSRFLAYTRSTILIINDYLFVHAGIINDIIRNVTKETKCEYFILINTIIRYWLINDSFDSDDKIKKYLQSYIAKKYNNNIKKLGNFTDYKDLFTNITNIIKEKNNNITSKLDSTSPTWNRYIGNEYNPNCNLVNILISKLQLQSIIVGHTVQNQGINSKCKNLLHRVDTGSSKAFEEPKEPQVLEIKDNQFNIIKMT